MKKGITVFSSTLWSVRNETFNKIIVQKLGSWEKIGGNELNSFDSKMRLWKRHESPIYFVVFL